MKDQPDETKMELASYFAQTPGLNTIWTSAWNDVSAIQFIPGYPIEDDIWIIPSAWATGGALSRPSARTLSFEKVAPEDWAHDDPRKTEVVRKLKRIAILMLTSTIQMRRRVVRPLKPSTWVLNSAALIRAARRSLLISDQRIDTPIFKCPEQVSIFRHLSPAEINRIKQQETTFAKAVVARLNGLYEADIIDDWLSRDVEVIRNGVLDWQPLNDEAIGAIGSAAIWMLDHIGPDLLECYKYLRQITTTSDGRSRRSDVNEFRKSQLAQWSGNLLTTGMKLEYKFICQISEDSDLIHDELDIEYRRSESNNNDKEQDNDRFLIVDKWPPVLPIHVKHIVKQLQTAHMIIIALATGMRDSELAEMERQSLRKMDAQDLVEGRTFKLSASLKGEKREWPLPRIAVRAIEQQERLAEIMSPGKKPLFVAFGARGDGYLHSSSSALTSFVSRIIDKNEKRLQIFEPDSVHLHRFRKTVARLAALSLMGANQILFDVLGHRNPEMTLSYILSDESLQDEMRQIAREAAILQAKTAFDDTISNGGAAAPHLRELMVRLSPRSAEKELDGMSLNRAAELLSQGGKVMLVRPGVLCTKSFNQFGPCCRRAGTPDIGRCQVSCKHRLELAAGRADCIRSIEQVLASITDQSGMMRTWWQGQLSAHIHRYDDIKERYLADPRVTTALST